MIWLKNQQHLRLLAGQRPCLIIESAEKCLILMGAFFSLSLFIYFSVIYRALSRAIPIRVAQLEWEWVWAPQPNRQRFSTTPDAQGTTNRTTVTAMERQLPRH